MNRAQRRRLKSKKGAQYRGRSRPAEIETTWVEANYIGEEE